MLHDKKIIKIRNNENTYYIGGVQVTSPSPFWRLCMTKNLACLQCKYHPIWQKSLCTLNPPWEWLHITYTDSKMKILMS